MTKDDILAMRPGRELDVIVAEKVMKELLADYRTCNPAERSAIRCVLNTIGLAIPGVNV